MKKPLLMWTLAIIITLGAAVYQRMTGPTYPKRCKVTIGNQIYKLKLVRSSDAAGDEIVKLEIPDNTVNGKIHLRRYLSKDEWTINEMSREGSFLSGKLPHQPPAGKVEYFIEFSSGNETVFVEKENPIVMRFKGAVPDLVLIPHIFIMFFAMLLSNLAGLLVLFKDQKQKLYGMLALGFLFLGGMILGPIVQKYAFGDLWTGVPYGWDLTDNKTLIGFIGWIIAVAGNWKKERPYLTLIAAVVLLLIYSIPHSLFGSTLSPETGKVTQGFIQFFGLY